jgi:hypothetical protein
LRKRVSGDRRSRGAAGPGKRPAPIVQHKTLETKQMVVTGGEGSTISDADCTG